jgi:hypothetical protein
MTQSHKDEMPPTHTHDAYFLMRDKGAALSAVSIHSYLMSTGHLADCCQTRALCTKVKWKKTNHTCAQSNIRTL